MDEWMDGWGRMDEGRKKQTVVKGKLEGCVCGLQGEDKWLQINDAIGSVLGGGEGGRK